MQYDERVNVGPEHWLVESPEWASIFLKKG